MKCELSVSFGVNVGESLSVTVCRSKLSEVKLGFVYGPKIFTLLKPFFYRKELLSN